MQSKSWNSKELYIDKVSYTETNYTTYSDRLLSESQGSLLEDEVLVQALKKSKSSSIEAEEKLSSSEKTEVVIDNARNVC